MTQITTTTQAGDIVIIIPGWVMRLVGFLGLFGGFTLALLFVFMGHAIEGFLIALFTLVWTPIWMLFHYILWRFYWYLLAAWLALQAFLWVGAALLVMGDLIVPGIGDLNLDTSSLKRSPINALFAVLLAALITAVLYRLYTLSRGSQPSDMKSKRADASEPAPAAPTPDEKTLMDRVLAKLERAGNRGEIRGDTIYVYKGGKHVGIVRVIDRPAAISPVMVKDVLNQRNRLGVDSAYLATSGHFTDETRGLADTWGIKLMTV